MTEQIRREHDLIGDADVPAGAYWGAHTARAIENFPISGVTLASQPHFVGALATVKQAAAVANRDVGELSDRLADAIVAACEDIRGGALHDQFVVDLIQGGAGTSTNMNVNEVVANRAWSTSASLWAPTRCCTRSSTSISGRAPTTSTRPRSSWRWTATCRPCSAANRVFIRSVDELRKVGVRVLFGPGEFEPHPPRTGRQVLDTYPWGLTLKALNEQKTGETAARGSV